MERGGKEGKHVGEESEDGGRKQEVKEGREECVGVVFMALVSGRGN